MRFVLLYIFILAVALSSCRSAKKMASDGLEANVEKQEGDAAQITVADPAAKKQTRQKKERKRTARKMHKQHPKNGGSSSDTAGNDEKSSVSHKQVNIEELTKMAQSGDSVAQTQLGIQYMKGEAVEKDINKALEWWNAAAEKGYAEAQYKLGICYQFGYGVKRSNERAKYWYKRAAVQKYNSAEVALKIIEEEENE